MPVHRLGQILRLSLRNVWRFRLQTALIVVAALSGSGGAIVSTGYAAGGREKILLQFSRLGANLLIVTPLESRAAGGRARTGSMVTTLNESDYRAILTSVKSIRGSSPTVAAVLRIRAGDLTKNTTIVGCDPAYFRMKSWTLSSGEFFALGANRRTVLLGATAERDLFAGQDPLGRRVIINRVPFVVAGVLAERGQGLDAANEDDQVYVPLQTALHRLLHIEYFHSIVFENQGEMNAVERQISAILEQRHQRVAPRGRDFQVQNQNRLLDAQLTAFGRLTFLVRWIAASALAVSSLGVFAVTWIGVRHRTREIGTRRALGAKPADVLVQFVAEGMAAALIGLGAGAVAGVFLLGLIDQRLGQPFALSGSAVAVDLVGSTLLYSAFTWVAGLRAARIQPSVALRSEL